MPLKVKRKNIKRKKEVCGVKSLFFPIGNSVIVVKPEIADSLNVLAPDYHFLVEKLEYVEQSKIKQRQEEDIQSGGHSNITCVFQKHYLTLKCDFFLPKQLKPLF